MDNVQKKALEVYPKMSRVTEPHGIIPADYKSHYIGDANEEKRIGFVEGYHQAEKDLIDKAVGWIGEIYNYHEIMRYSDSCEPPLSELTEWFKNYIKEGGKKG